MSTKHQLNALREQVCSLADEVGLFLKGEVNKLDLSQLETKSLNSLVSYVDKQAEQMLVKKLSELLPGSGFLAEEGTASSQGQDYIWIIDPLDGTTNYIHRLPVYSISIALQHKGQTIMGVVFEVNNSEMFWAIKDEGAYLDGKRIFASNKQKMEVCLVATGFPYFDYSILEKYIKYLVWCMRNTRGVRRFGSAAVDLAYVACGRFDGFFEYSLNPWDVAAGSLIVHEAGGTVTNFSGTNNYLHCKQILAAGKIIHSLMLEKAKELKL
jgi:myo-inositol-1(or 4)-monophosphatase